MKVLLIARDADVIRSITTHLSTAKLRIFAADSETEGLEHAKSYSYDIIVWMVHQPDPTGLLHQLRAARNKTPVLVISALNGIEPKLEAFQAGADDHLTIPFDHRELVARIHAIVRRSHGYTSSVITAGQVSVNLDEKTANVEGCPLRLTRREFDFLTLLVLRKGTIIPKQSFLDHLYGGIDEPQQKIVDAFICKLRKKLKRATGGEHYIETVWGTGYRFTESEHPPPKATAAE